MNVPAVVVTPAADERPRRLLTAFLAGRTSTHTRDAYAADIPLWLDWCTSAGVDPLDARHAHVQTWLSHLAGAEATRARRLAAVSSFYRWLLREEQVPRNPCQLDAEERPHPDPYPTGGALSRAQVDRMLAAADTDGARTAVVIGLLAFTGVRVAELTAANVDDITLDQGRPILTVHGKGRRRRDAPLPPDLYRRITHYLTRRLPGRDIQPWTSTLARSLPLVATETGRRLDRAQVRRDVQRVARHAGGDLADLAPRLSPHWLRRAYGTDLLDAGVPVRDVQYAMGHADPRTTERYDRGRLRPDRHPTYRRAAQLSAREDGDHAA